MEKEKNLLACSYLGIFIFLPLLRLKRNQWNCFHLNQGLHLFISYLLNFSFTMLYLFVIRYHISGDILPHLFLFLISLHLLFNLLSSLYGIYQVAMQQCKKIIFLHFFVFVKEKE